MSHQSTDDYRQMAKERYTTVKMNTPTTSSTTNNNNVNLPTAYILYFLGGTFGLHHAYLNRPNQALAWYSTLGMFGIGLLRDLFKIPYYVSICRDDQERDVTARVRAAHVEARDGISPWSFGRMILMIIFGSYFGFLTSCLVALPRKEENDSGDALWWTNVVYGLLRAFGCAIGIWLVGNMGEEMIYTTKVPKEDGTFHQPDDNLQKGEFMKLTQWCTGSFILLNSPALGGIIYAVRRRKYRPTMTPQQSSMKRVGKHIMKCIVFSALMTIAIYNHGSINFNGHNYRLSDAVKNAINSNFWKEFDFEQFRQQQQSSSGGGSDYLKKAFDISGERSARRTLGVARNATHAEVRSAYKKLALKYHPDKIGTDATEKEIEETNRQFVKVQEAYDVLNSIEQDRKKKERGATTEEGASNGGNSGSGHRTSGAYRGDEM